MSVQAVKNGSKPMIPADPCHNSDTPLWKGVASLKAVYINRLRATALVYGGQHNVEQMSNQPTNPRASFLATAAEVAVLREFVSTCGALEADDKFGSLHNSVTCSFFYTWLVFESATSTMRNSGFQLNRAYFVDESYTVLNEDHIAKCYSKDPSVADPGGLARHGVDVYNDICHLSKKFYDARLDEVEQAALLHLLILECASTTNIAPGEFSRRSGEIFKQLQKHYMENYENVPIRLGEVILLMQEIQRVKHAFSEHIVLMKLNGRRSILES
ncbi:hypothetical protein AAVH_35204 [Aphelenchoides avenae]|nr:hypothetical protein AAVH_35204 [Aphelenchus avenae]